MITLDGAKIRVTCGNSEIGYYRLLDASKTLPPHKWVELCNALDSELRNLFASKGPTTCRKMPTA